MSSNKKPKVIKKVPSIENKRIENNANKIKLIWIDKKNYLNNKKYFDTNENDKIKKTKISQIIDEFQDRFSFKPYSEIKTGVEELKKIKFQHCYVIISGRYFQDYVDIMKEEGKKLKCDPNVFVFTSNKFSDSLNKRIIDKDDKFTRPETLNYVDDRFFNKGGVYSEMTKINEKINELEKENDINVKNSDIYNEDKNKNIELESIKDTNEKMFTFQIKSVQSLIFPSMYKKIISYEEKNKQIIKDFLIALKKKDYCEKTKKGQIFVNDLIKPLINLLDVKNFPEEILIKYLIYIYSLETDFYKDMNKYLSTKGKQGIYETFISLMYRGLYLDVFVKNKDYKKLTLYRAQLMNKEEITNIKNLYNKKTDSLPGEILFSNSFLSFTYDNMAYFKFLKNAKNLVTILFIIENGADLDFNSNADLEGLSKYVNEREILFFPFSCFTIESIDENYNNYIFQNKTKKNIVVTKIKLNYLGKYKETIKKEIKTINIDEYMLNLKDDDFYNELKKFNVIENLDGKKIFE